VNLSGGPRQQAVRDATVEQLRAVRDAGRPLGKDLLSAAAERCGTSARSLRRWVDGDVSPRHAGFAFDDTHKALLAAFGGNIAQAYELARRDGIHGGVTYKTWTNAWKALSDFERTLIIAGEQDAKQHQFYVERTPELPGSVFQLDGWQPNIMVRAPGRRADAKVKYCFPHVLMVTDAGSRMVLGATVLYPKEGKRAGMTSEFAVASMTAALRPRIVMPDEVDALGCFEGLADEAFVVGGVPDVLVTDHDDALSGQLMHELADACGFEVDLAAPYTPEGKGKVERLFRSFERGKMFLLDGQTKGPRGYEDQQPFAEQYAEPWEFEQLLLDVIDEYNFRTVHSSLGMTHSRGGPAAGGGWARSTTSCCDRSAWSTRTAMARARSRSAACASTGPTTPWPSATCRTCTRATRSSCGSSPARPAGWTCGSRTPPAARSTPAAPCTRTRSPTATAPPTRRSGPVSGPPLAASSTKPSSYAARRSPGSSAATAGPSDRPPTCSTCSPT
jgi:hypothetical protein